ncbi:MAG: squalene-hopene cyclase [Isosphaeraceae bacterium]|jgi:squalene-hopene/tetraprenyl-beta-curcumene cyclase|nr:MAG: squalene-hopene cyclase [Isosphaeraceae bacterium]
MIAYGNGTSASTAPTGVETMVSPRALDLGLKQARDWFLDRQHDSGHWVGELEGDTILESEYVLLMAYLGREHEPVCERLCRYLLERRLPGGGWAIYPGGPFELSASVKAYFALKLVGFQPDHPALSEARARILEAGGAQACNSFTRFYLALLGQIPYSECPSVPTELVLIPSWLGFSLAAMSAWTRTIVVPLSIMSAYRPVRPIPSERGIAELFRADLPRTALRRRGLSWENFFLAVDRGFKLADRFLPKAWRNPGIRAAHRWMLEHFEGSDGLGAIFPPMIYTIIALDCLGYDRNDELVRWAHQQLDDLFLEDEDGTRIQPCVSPVWDTAIAMIALSDAGLPPNHPALCRAARWILDHEVRTAGDWSIRRPGLEPTGWHFQYRNSHYPDIDDTAMVLLALRRTAAAHDPEARAATQRAVAWLLAMQNRDGGWAAFDVNIDNEVLTKVPFADHNAMLDPSCADITARVLEVLGGLGYRADHPSVARGLDYLWRTQEPEGCWYGRWGVNYIYGTWQVLLGLRALDFPMDHPRARRAADWLESVQQPGGGWGETCASYDDPTLKGQGEPTASQTAWAILGLIAAGRAHTEAVRRGIRFLLENQTENGTWEEPQYTGTGFPRVFYLKYHYYRNYFPLMALGRYRAAVGLPTPSISPRAAIPARLLADPRSGQL